VLKSKAIVIFRKAVLASEDVFEPAEERGGAVAAIQDIEHTGLELGGEHVAFVGGVQDDITGDFAQDVKEEVAFEGRPGAYRWPRSNAVRPDCEAVLRARNGQPCL